MLRTKYPMIHAYLDNRLPQLVSDRASQLLSINENLSQMLALDMVASELSEQLGIEHEQIEEQVREEDIAGTLSDEMISLYDRSFDRLERVTYRQELVNLTGTRTLLR